MPDITYRNLGRTGLKISEICLGAMQFGWTADEPTSYAVMTAAWEAGVNFWDTADVYSRWAGEDHNGISETLIGNWLHKGGAPRDQIIIATKVRSAVGPGPNDQGLSRGHILNAVEASLRRLRTDYIDLYQSHAYEAQPPIDETLRAFDDLVRQGKVRYVGCSNYPAWRLMQALWASDAHGLARYDSLQPHYSLVHRAEYERELEAVCRAYDIGVMPYSPLGAGFLTGKYRSGQPIPAGSRGESSARIKSYMHGKNWALLELLEEIGQTHGKSVSQVSLAWLLARPGITSPIIGPKTVEQLQDNLGAVGWRLSAEEVQAIDKASAWE